MHPFSGQSASTSKILTEFVMAETLLLTGRPGVGKTTIIKSVTQTLGEAADGFFTEEIRELGKRQGFQLVGLRGERAILAHVQLQRRGCPRVGRYGVDVDTLERVGVGALERAITQGRIVIIDEIGKMELFSDPFKRSVLAAMDGQAPLIATLTARPHPWVDKLKARIETRPDVTLWQVTIENRDGMALQVLDWVQSQQETGHGR
jgi:nucleoside-triphosphatase